MSKIGSINERGFINDIDKRGFTIIQCLCELIANSIDAKAKFVKFQIESNFIKIIDDGEGMTKEHLTNMWDMLRQNHLEDESMGISGLGAKAATKILSQDKEVKLITNNKGNYITNIVPWNQIVKEGIYTDKIIMTDKTSEEDKRLFRNERNDIFTGTTIFIPYNENLHYIIENIFSNKSTSKEKYDLLFEKRVDMIFGEFSNINIIFH